MGNIICKAKVENCFIYVGKRRHTASALVFDDHATTASVFYPRLLINRVIRQRNSVAGSSSSTKTLQQQSSIEIVVIIAGKRTVRSCRGRPEQPSIGLASLLHGTLEASNMGKSMSSWAKFTCQFAVTNIMEAGYKTGM